MAGDFKARQNNNRQQRGGRGRGRDDRNNRRPRREEVVEEKVWVPKTQLGKEVLAGRHSTIDDVLKTGQKVMEAEITEYLVPQIETEFINVGQAKGKFGGGKRKTSKPTQKKSREGNKMSFAMIVVSGNREGVVGLGIGKARETVPSREKAVRNAKQNLILIRRGNGSWGSYGAGHTSIPFTVEGKCGSSVIRLIPAPVGTGLVVEKEVKKMLELAGIKDVWSKTFGNTKNKYNLMQAAFNALKQLQKVRLNPLAEGAATIKEGTKDEQHNF